MRPGTRSRALTQLEARRGLKRKDLLLSWWQEHLPGKLHLFTTHYKPLLLHLRQRHSLDLGACLTAAGCNLGSRSHFSPTKRGHRGLGAFFRTLPVPASRLSLGSRLSGGLQITPRVYSFVWLAVMGGGLYQEPGCREPQGGRPISNLHLENRASSRSGESQSGSLRNPSQPFRCSQPGFHCDERGVGCRVLHC